MAKVKVQTGLRLDEELYEKVRVLAEIEGRSLNNLIEHITRKFITAYEAQNGPLPVTRD